MFVENVLFFLHSRRVVIYLCINVKRDQLLEHSSLLDNAHSINRRTWTIEAKFINPSKMINNVLLYRDTFIMPYYKGF